MPLNNLFSPLPSSAGAQHDERRHDGNSAIEGVDDGLMAHMGDNSGSRGCLLNPLTCTGNSFSPSVQPAPWSNFREKLCGQMDGRL